MTREIPKLRRSDYYSSLLLAGSSQEQLRKISSTQHVYLEREIQAS